jgi:hypothetical protein
MTRGHVLLPILAGLGVLWVGVQQVSADDSRANLTPDMKIAESFTGCQTIEDTIRFYQLLNEGDSLGTIAWLKPRRTLEMCADLEAGTRVAVEKRQQNDLPEYQTDLGNFYCVRPYGTPNCFWAFGHQVFGKKI